MTSAAHCIPVLSLRYHLPSETKKSCNKSEANQTGSGERRVPEQNVGRLK